MSAHSTHISEGKVGSDRRAPLTNAYIIEEERGPTPAHIRAHAGNHGARAHSRRSKATRTRRISEASPTRFHMARGGVSSAGAAQPTVCPTECPSRSMGLLACTPRHPTAAADWTCCAQRRHHLRRRRQSVARRMDCALAHSSVAILRQMHPLNPPRSPPPTTEKRFQLRPPPAADASA